MLDRGEYIAQAGIPDVSEAIQLPGPYDTRPCNYLRIASDIRRLSSWVYPKYQKIPHPQRPRQVAP